MPHVIIIAGPNGSGKTTAAPALLRDTLHVVDYKSEISVGYAFAKIFGGAENNAYFSDDVSDSLFITNTTDLGFQGPFIRFFVNFDL